MKRNKSTDIRFIDKVVDVIYTNLHSENFGVSELATQLHMSRSNLYLRVKSIAGISVSQFIRNVRLEKGRELLSQTNKTASEVAFDVGFSSTSYFTKCFHDYFGYPPGEYHKIAHASYRTSNGIRISRKLTARNRITTTTIVLSLLVVIALLVIYFSIEHTY